MKKSQLLKRIFLVLAVLLSDVMCAVVAYNYCSMQWGIRYGGYSAPAGVAFLPAIPYSAGILACLALAWFFHRRGKTGHF